METLRTGWMRVAAHPLARAVSSPRLTLAGLGCLFVLVIVGTLYQADNGIYDAQLLYFRSWIAWVGMVPIPGARSVLWVLAVNLVGSLAFRVRWIPSNTGLILAHAGLVVLLAGGLGSAGLARSSLLGLVEGQVARVSHDPYRWELHLATADGMVTVPLERLAAGTRMESPIPGLSLTVGRVLTASRPVLDTEGRLTDLAPVMPDRDAEKNIPGLTLRVGDTAATPDLHLFGGDERPVQVTGSGLSFAVWLGRRAYPLPAPVRLVRFEAEEHPGTDIPARFRSTLRVGEEESGREAVITMNRPLTLAGHTLYQTSWGRDAEGRLVSIIEVVRNPVRVLPYLSSLLILAGLVAHVVLRRGAAA